MQSTSEPSAESQRPIATAGHDALAGATATATGSWEARRSAPFKACRATHIITLGVNAAIGDLIKCATDRELGHGQRELSVPAHVELRRAGPQRERELRRGPMVAARQSVHVVPLEWSREIRRTVEASRLPECNVRVMITRGVGPMGLDLSDAKEPSVICFALPLQTYLDAYDEQSVAVGLSLAARASDGTRALDQEGPRVRACNCEKAGRPRNAEVANVSSKGRRALARARGRLRRDSCPRQRVMSVSGLGPVVLAS